MRCGWNGTGPGVCIGDVARPKRRRGWDDISRIKRRCKAHLVLGDERRRPSSARPGGHRRGGAAPIPSCCKWCADLAERASDARACLSAFGTQRCARARMWGSMPPGMSAM